jgi:hypothetical protein
LAQWTQGVLRNTGYVLSLQFDPASRRIMQPQYRAADGRFAAAAFSDEAQCLPFGDVKADTIDSPNKLRLLAEHAVRHAAADREMFGKILDCQNRRHRFAPSSSLRQQAARCCALP